MVSRPVFYIIDGHALAYRQFFALPIAGFSTRTGEPTNASYGFARTLLDILQREKPTYIAVSFDRGLSGRDTLYPDYKGTREKMPEELRTQLGRIHQIVEAFNMPVLALDGYEADDVIGSIVSQAETADTNVRVVTGDRDILQLLTEHVTVQIPRRGEADAIYDVVRFRDEYGLEPWQLIHLKALMGDNSDNIPGVKGIGEKTATRLLQQYETIEKLYEHIAQITGANQKKLIDGRDMAFLSKDLATIRKDVPIALDLSACLSHDYDVSRVDALFGELEFRSLRDRLPKAAEQLVLFETDTTSAAMEPSEHADLAAPPVKTIIVDTIEKLGELVDRLNQSTWAAWDVETTSTDQMSARLVGIALAVDEAIGYYIPVGHQAGEQIPLQIVLDALRAPLTDSAIGKLAHNAAYDLVVMQRYGIDVSPVSFDTMIAEWVRHPEGKFLGLKNLARQDLKIHMTEISELIGSGKKQVTMDLVPIEQAAPYAAADAAITYRLANHLRAKLEEENLVQLFTTLEMPLVPVIAAIEQAGVVLDTYYLAELSDRMANMLARLELLIYDDSGYGPFNINSPRQLNDVLFGKLGLAVTGARVRRTTHGYSTDASVLESLKGQHPIIEHILEYREINKLKNTYVDTLPTLINPQTGRVHTSYNQTGTATGRISSSNPNLQNIPIRTDLGREVRRAFVAAQGTKLLSVDYSQVELRILAHLSQDQTLLEAFAQGQDIHAATAAAVYSIPLDQVTKEQRTFAKRVNFGLIYGMGAFRLARDSNLTLREAQEFIDTYFERLPGVRHYLDQTKAQARKGPIETLFGRRRTFPILLSASSRSNQVAVQGEERVAINMPIQGSAADIMKRAMINLFGELQQSGLDARMILQVHDELVLEVAEAHILQTRDTVIRVMESAYQLDAPLKTNAQVGANWRDMEPI